MKYRLDQVLRATALVVALMLLIVSVFTIQNEVRFYLGDHANRTMLDGLASGTDIGLYRWASGIQLLGTACLIAIMTTQSAHRELKFFAALLITITYWLIATVVLSFAVLVTAPVSTVSVVAMVIFFASWKSQDATALDRRQS